MCDISGYAARGHANRPGRASMNDRPLPSYRPNPLFERAFRLAFDNIEVDEGWLRAVRDAQARGTVVYVLRNLSLVDFLALDHLTKRHRLPQIQFANDMGVWMLEPMRGGWMHALRGRSEAEEVRQLFRAIREGASAALFLKKRPQVLDAAGRGTIEGDALIRALFDAQRSGPRRLLLIPQVFVWSRSSNVRAGNLGDALFGSSEWPGNLRSIGQFLANWRHATLRAGEPVDMQEFLAREGPDVPDDVLVRRLTYTLLRRLERERRAILGPARKPADRIREEVLRSPKLQKVIADMAGEGAKERTVITARARAMLRELQAELDMNAIAALARVVAPAQARMFSAVEVDEAGIEALRERAKEGALVILPSHKSHMDYVMLAWVFYERKLPLPLIAAGDNLNFFPVGPLLRRAGAFFIRRTFGGDRLYSAVVDAYVRRTIRDGAALEFFLEGGRSRTGKLLPPRLGLLSLVVDAVLGVSTRTTWFCPVSIGYERFVEEKALVHELTGGEKQKENMRGLMRSVDIVKGRYGRLTMQFGKPLTLTDVLREVDPNAHPDQLTKMSPPRRRAVITRLAYRVMNEINAVTSVTPGSLVATALLAHDRRGLPESELVKTCQDLARMLTRAGARFSPSLAPRDDEGGVRSAALHEAVQLFVRARSAQIHRVASEEIYTVPPEARLSLDLAKNGIIHFFAARALIATALLAAPGPPLLLSAARERVLALSRLFKYEFTFRADAPFERIFDEEIAAMERDAEIVRVVLKRDDGIIALAPADDAGRKRLELYARIIHNFVEGYRVAARGLQSLLRGPVSAKDVLKRALSAGERMFLAGEITRPEAISRPLVDNAYSSFVDQGYLSRNDGKLALAESYATASAVATIESRIEAMGVRPERPS
jgi:glycerol-3-phosphate O-acyltransferase